MLKHKKILIGFLFLTALTLGGCNNTSDSNISNETSKIHTISSTIGKSATKVADVAEKVAKHKKEENDTTPQKNANVHEHKKHEKVKEKIEEKNNKSKLDKIKEGISPEEKDAFDEARNKKKHS